MNQTQIPAVINVSHSLSDFRDKFDELKEVINAANFIAIDCEFTGLTQDNAKVQQYDSPSEFFHKICQQTRYDCHVV